MNKNGIIIINKPLGITSFDVVKRVRDLFFIKKVGHCGTLDPLATGVLPILCGKATKCFDILEKKEKQYTASFKLGITTDTQDITGKILKKTINFSVDEVLLKEKLSEFLGITLQIPPMYSALKKNGTCLYKLARNNKEVEREARKISIDRISLLSFNRKRAEGKFLIICSKGTYVRTLCNDLGEKLGCGATMTNLQRTNLSGFSLKDSVSLNNLKKSDLKPLEILFKDFKKTFITKPQSIRFSNGGSLFLERLNFEKKVKNKEIIRVYDENILLGLGKIHINLGEMICFKNFSEKEQKIQLNLHSH